MGLLHTRVSHGTRLQRVNLLVLEAKRLWRELRRTVLWLAARLSGDCVLLRLHLLGIATRGLRASLHHRLALLCYR